MGGVGIAKDRANSKGCSATPARREGKESIMDELERLREEIAKLRKLKDYYRDSTLKMVCPIIRKQREENERLLAVVKKLEDCPPRKATGE